MNIMNGMLSDLKSTSANGFAEEIEMIPIDKIEGNDKNFYELSALELLADDIERQGLQHNLVVAENGDKYMLISGHRRFEAVKFLNENNRLQSSFLPCKVRKYSNEDEKTLDLIMLNATSRKLTDGELLQQFKIVSELLEKMKNIGRISGKTRENIAQMLNVSPSRVRQFENIDKNASEDVKSAVTNGQISVSTADEIASFSKDEQADILSSAKENSEDNEVHNGKVRKSAKKLRKAKGEQSEFDTAVKAFLKWFKKSDKFEENWEYVALRLKELQDEIEAN